MADLDHFLNVVNVSKTFEPETAAQSPIQVIDDVSMSLETGEFAVYLGPSGCGKTTLMRIVGGLETASGGEVFLAGERVTGPDRRKGMVFQAYTSFPWADGAGEHPLRHPVPRRHRAPRRRRRSRGTISSWSGSTTSRTST